MKRYLLITLLVITHVMAKSQNTRFVVQLTDKNNSPYSLSAPQVYLTQKAIDRRTKQNIVIDSTDLPVNPAYINQIANAPGVTVLNYSKWLNQVTIKATDSAAAFSVINTFSFVAGSKPVALRAPSTPVIIPVTPLPVPVVTGTKGVTGVHGVQGENVLNYGKTNAQIRIHNGQYLHNMGYTGGGISIAMVDAGFSNYLTNPAFATIRSEGRILGIYDFVAKDGSVNEDNAHGAYCFSIIGGSLPGQFIGTAPNASYWLFRTEDAATEYPIEEQNWAAAAEYADSVGVDLITSSLGYTNFDNPAFNIPYAQRNGVTSVITQAANMASRKGIIVLISAGNSGGSSDDTKYISCPADGNEILAVGGVDTLGNLYPSSSWGPNFAGKTKPDITSVGLNTYFVNNVGNITFGNGTSFSNPNVSGLVACLLQALPALKVKQIDSIVVRSSDRYSHPDDHRFGYGIPDFKRAFVLGLTINDSVKATNTAPQTNMVNWNGYDNNTMQYVVSRKLPSELSFTDITTVNGTAVTLQPGTYSYTDNTVPANVSGTIIYQVRQVIPGDTTFPVGVASVQSILPVTLISFTAHSTNNGNVVSWQTTQETNSDYFELEYSNSGSSFSAIARIPSAVQSNTLQSYSYLHNTAVSPAWYRLKMVDRDGHFAYSEIIKITRSGDALNITEISPVPFNETITIKLLSPSAQQVAVSLIDMNGRIYKFPALQVIAGEYPYPVTGLATLSTGMYILQLETKEGEKTVRKVMKK